MAELPSSFYDTTIQAEPLQGGGAYGETFAAAVTVPATLRMKLHRVRNEEGVEVTSEGTVLHAIEHAPSTRPGSRLTFPDGSTRRVITQHTRMDGGFGAWQHVALYV